MIDFSSMKMNFAGVGHRCEVSADTIASAPFLKEILEKNSGTFSKLYYEGFSEKTIDDFMKIFSDLGGRKIYENLFHNTNEEALFLFDGAFITLSLGNNKYNTISIVSKNDKITEVCKATFPSFFTSPAKKGYVFAILKGAQGNLHLSRIGYAGSALVRENYTKSIIDDYDFVIEDLKAKDPSGRIVLLDGVPGTGKSFLLRGILMDMAEAMFVMVPPNMVSSLGGPELLPLLIKNKEDYSKKGPTVFILEDADQCLAPREADNISSISSILNMGDGILGSLFDIRILATTNAKAKDLDPAIIRDGRLSKKITIGALKLEDANVIYQRLLKDPTKTITVEIPEKNGLKPTVTKEKFTLAEIYKMARNAGWKPESKEEVIPGADAKSTRDLFDVDFDEEDF